MLAAVLGGVPAGLVAAAAGWALSFFLVADQSLEALIALPVWLAAAGLVGWLSDRARTAARERDRAGRALAAVRDVAAEAVVPLDAEGAVAGWSPGATAMYGYAEEEIVGRPLADLFVDEGEAERLLAAVEEGETLAAQQAVHRRSDGTELVVAVSAVPVGDGREALLVAHDTSEVGRIGERLGEVEAKYRSLTSHLPVVTYVRAADADGAPTFVSPQVDRLLGYTAEEWLADPGSSRGSSTPTTATAWSSGSRPHASARRPARSSTGSSPATAARSGCATRQRSCSTLAAGRCASRAPSSTSPTGRRPTRTGRSCARAEATATAEAHDRQRKVDFVAAAAAVLSSSLDHRKTLEEAASLAVRELADSCVVDVREEDGRVARLVAERAEPPPSSPEPEPEPEAEVLGVVRDGRPLVTAERIVAPLVSRAGRASSARSRW